MNDRTAGVNAADLFAGGGEMGGRMAAFDWSRSPLGPLEAWPQSLRTCVRIVLTSRQPMFVWWGDELINLYNDAYISIVGGKHPDALGTPARLVWREIWHEIGPRAEIAMRAQEGTYDEALLLIVERYGYPEETYYTFSYSPVPNDHGGTGGILCANSVETERIVGERQLAVLRELAARAADAHTLEEACSRSASALAIDPKDIPFALLYFFADGDRGSLRLLGTTGVEPGHRAAPLSIAIDDDSCWPLADVLTSKEIRIVDDLGTRLDRIPRGTWPQPSREAALLPVTPSGREQPTGVLVVGLNPFRLFDAEYRGFLALVSGQIAVSTANAQAYQAEKKRAEMLAELDRAKTVFFGNVSHEFRTPLTLMLGPIEDALAHPSKALTGRDLETAHRNALRLLRLVNTLLDFSRIEAGRTQATFEPTDLSQATSDLAGVFRSAIESAGLELSVRCSPLAEPIFVDREAWEKIVLNLLSNAFKFTFDGEIAVDQQLEGDHVVLRVCDTGPGIAADQLPRLFERFHRIEGTRARTHEGSGIGLALVRELVRLHGGEIRAESELGRGTTFIVRIPTGHAHLPGDRVVVGRARLTGPGATAYADEASRWLLDSPESTEVVPDVGPSDPSARILVVDDNLDMRGYLVRILGQRWSVTTACDGKAALAAARVQRFDLVLTDVMLPRLDGFGLLRALRYSPKTRSIPVVMLSARAGEESRLEGIEAGVDDYIAKPFSARELTARVALHLKLSAARREAETASRAKDRFLAMLGHELRNPLAPMRNAIALVASRLARGENVDRPLEILGRQTENLARLVDDILDVSRVTRGYVELRPRVVDFAALVDGALASVERLMEGKAQDLRVTLPRRAVLVFGDPVRLEQIVVNLLTNASKYTDSGGSIAISVEPHADRVELRVRDNGVGIEQGLLVRIFDLFQQAERSLDRSDGGLGIGLTITRRLVELHRGTIEALSDGPGRGAEFVVRLPLAARADTAVADAAPHSVTIPTLAHASRRILVVDDNQDNAETIAELLSGMGHEVRIAHDGPSAIDCARALLPDLVLLDIGLPGLDGYEVAKRLRRVPECAGALLVALTGYGQPDDRQRSTKAGFDEHLVKPISAQLLARLVADSVRNGGRTRAPEPSA